MTWAAADIGRFQFTMNSLALIMGWHVREGLEENLFLDEAKQRLTRSVDLVRRVASLAWAAERTVASPVQAHQMIGLPNASTP